MRRTGEAGEDKEKSELTEDTHVSHRLRMSSYNPPSALKPPHHVLQREADPKTYLHTPSSPSLHPLYTLSTPGCQHVGDAGGVKSSQTHTKHAPASTG